MRLRFGDCVFDGDTREVIRGEQPVAVSPKAFDLLAALIEARPDAVSKADIHARLWPDVHVSEANLPNLIGELRTALGDEARMPRIIRTVPRYGYAFCPEVRPERRLSERTRTGSDFVYRLIWGPREISLDQGENLIGRDHQAVIWIDDERVSRRHARIVIESDDVVIEDLGSKNGTYVDGRKIRGRASLANRATVKIGPATLTFRVMRRTGSTRSTKNKEPD